MRYLLTFVIGLMLLTGSRAQAAFQTGNQLLRLCSSNDASERGVCLGYGEAVIDTWDGSFACAPAGIEAQQVADVLVRYLNAHPESREKDAGSLAFIAVQAAWPCPKAAPKK